MTHSTSVGEREKCKRKSERLKLESIFLPVRVCVRILCFIRDSFRIFLLVSLCICDFLCVSFFKLKRIVKKETTEGYNFNKIHNFKIAVFKRKAFEPKTHTNSIAIGYSNDFTLRIYREIHSISRDFNHYLPNRFLHFDFLCVIRSREDMNNAGNFICVIHQISQLTSLRRVAASVFFSVRSLFAVGWMRT